MQTFYVTNVEMDTTNTSTKTFTTDASQNVLTDMDLLMGVAEVSLHLA